MITKSVELKYDWRETKDNTIVSFRSESNKNWNARYGVYNFKIWMFHDCYFSYIREQLKLGLHKMPDDLMWGFSGSNGEHNLKDMVCAAYNNFGTDARITKQQFWENTFGFSTDVFLD